MSTTEEYRQEKERIRAIFPEACRKCGENKRMTLPIPQTYEHYLRAYKDPWIAAKMWRGRVTAWAHELDCIRSEENPSPGGEMAIINAMGYGRAFSAEAKAARRKAAEARLVARQKTSQGYRRLVKEGKDPKLEAERLTSAALAYMPN